MKLTKQVVSPADAEKLVEALPVEAFHTFSGITGLDSEPISAESPLARELFLTWVAAKLFDGQTWYAYFCLKMLADMSVLQEKMGKLTNTAPEPYTARHIGDNKEMGPFEHWPAGAMLGRDEYYICALEPGFKFDSEGAAQAMLPPFTEIRIGPNPAWAAKACSEQEVYLAFSKYFDSIAEALIEEVRKRLC